MYSFSKQTLDLLYEAGWKEDRHFDTTEYERLLKTHGHPVFPVVHDFLQSFGGLKIHHPHLYVEGVWEEMDLSISEYTAEVRIYNASDLAEDIGTPVCLIGNFYNRMMCLFMSASGYVYGDSDYYFQVGTSGPDAIEAICTNRKFTDISETTNL